MPKGTRDVQHFDLANSSAFQGCFSSSFSGSGVSNGWHSTRVTIFVAEFVRIQGFSAYPRTLTSSATAVFRFKISLPALGATVDGLEGDDGFGWRRRVLAGALKYLAASGRVFLSVSSQYGMRRVMGLLEEAPGFQYGGVLASTEWVPFDLARPDLLDCLRLYAQEEHRGGLSYAFHDPAASGHQTRTATSALERYDQFGESPLMKWQTLLFERLGDP